MPPLHLLDSIALVTPDMSDAVIVTGSHGGSSAAGFVLAMSHKPFVVFFNDAGIGKDNAGIAALAMLQSQGICAAVYAHTSARIGDAQDGLDNGCITRVNHAAELAGVCEGQMVRAAVELLQTPRARSAAN